MRQSTSFPKNTFLPNKLRRATCLVGLLAASASACSGAEGDATTMDMELDELDSFLDDNISTCGSATAAKTYDSMFPTGGFTSPSNYANGSNGCVMAYFVDVEDYRDGNTESVNQVEYVDGAATTQAACEARNIRVYVFDQTHGDTKFISGKKKSGVWANSACTNPKISFESDLDLPATFDLHTERNYKFAVSARDNSNSSSPVMKPIKFSSRVQRAPFLVTDVNTTTNENGTDLGALKVALAKKPTANVTLRFRFNEDEGSLTNSTGHAISSLTFTPDNWNTKQTINVDGRNDTAADGSREYWFQFTNSESTDPFYEYSLVNDGILPAPIQFVNADDDYGIVPSIVGTIAEGNSEAIVNYKLSRKPSSNVTVTFKTSNLAVASLGGQEQRTATFTPDNWNTSIGLTVRSEFDFVPERPDSSFTITATAASTDANFNNKTASTSHRAYDMDQTFVLPSQAAGPSTCSASSGTTRWNYTNDTGQSRSFATTTPVGTNRVGIDVLHVIIQSTYMRTLTQDDIRREKASFSEAMVKMHDATHGLLDPVGRSIVIPRHFSRASFHSCANHIPGDTCVQDGKNLVHIGDYEGIAKEIAKQTNPDNWDFVAITLATDDWNAGTDGDRFRSGGAWAFGLVPDAYAEGQQRGWHEGKVVVYAHRGGTARADLWLHEIAHQLEWTLERGGRPQMHNPDVQFWQDAVAEPNGGGGHWDNEGSQQHVLAYYWMQRGQWPAITTASVHPRGYMLPNENLGREIYAHCSSNTEYFERLQQTPTGR